MSAQADQLQTLMEFFLSGRRQRAAAATTPTT